MKVAVEARPVVQSHEVAVREVTSVLRRLLCCRRDSALARVL